MSSTSITNVMTELFSAPLQAAVNAERDYRRIWAEWMSYQLALATAADGKTLRPGVNLAEIMKTAPVVSVDGHVEMSVTMRIAAVKERSGGLGFGLAIGPIYASGNFGFMSRTTEESVFQAQAKFTLSNTGRNLTDSLKQLNLTPTSPAELATAITELGKYMEKPEIKDGAVVKPQ